MEIKKLFKQREELKISIQNLQQQVTETQQGIDEILQITFVDFGLLTVEQIEVLQNYTRNSLEVSLAKAIALYIYCLQTGDPWFEKATSTSYKPSFEAYPGKI